MTALFGTMNVHVAIIEWADDVDPTSYIAHNMEDLQKQVRSAIEHEHSPLVDEVDAYVRGPGKEVVDFDEWHDVVHEFDGCPWVTIEQHTIEIV